ncbi:MAG: hypothetical protein QM742_03365 [Aquabacterium sp.]
MDVLVAFGGADQSGQISSWRDFEDRFRAALAVAAAQPVDMLLMDTDFRHWPLGQRSVMEAFHQWGLSSKGTHCQLLAAHYDDVSRQHPLWVAWHRTWAHRVQCHQVPEELAQQLKPTLILKGTLGLHVLEPLRGSGIWTRDPGTLSEWSLEIDAILQRSEPAMPPTTLGL